MVTSIVFLGICIVFAALFLGSIMAIASASVAAFLFWVGLVALIIAAVFLIVIIIGLITYGLLPDDSSSLSKNQGFVG
jgi:hypothetical protein